MRVDKPTDNTFSCSAVDSAINQTNVKIQHYIFQFYSTVGVNRCSHHQNKVAHCKRIRVLLISPLLVWSVDGRKRPSGNV